MSKIKISLPDGSIMEYDNGIEVGEVALELGDKLRGGVLAGKVNGRLVDLSFPLREDAEVRFITFEEEEGKEIYWHSTSHIMAQAVKELFPKAKLAIGPAISEGFYYDFDLDKPFTPEDLEKIEEKMKEIIAADLKIERIEMAKEKSLEFLKDRGEDYKIELVNELEADKISFYRQGEFIDMCLGPHLPSTGKIGAFKLLKVSGAYWRGDETRKMLQRIYGISFPTQAELAEFLANLQEAEKRDHRKLGKALDLFSIREEAGPGLVLWHPHGAIVRKIIEDFWMEEHKKRNYQIVYTPHIAKIGLWEQSGHTEFYKENMFFMEIEGQKYVLKPMNCPGHILIYKSQTRSYRDLPLRYAELGTVYRYERSGVLHGMNRVRGFTIDDAHIFCTPEQLKSEISEVYDLMDYMMKKFGFLDYIVHLATRPEKYAGTAGDWDRAEATLAEVLKERKVKYELDEGGAVFYGPKIDVKIKDALGRLWQGPTIQFDFNLPARFEVTYIGSDGKEHLVVMVHRAILGSLERFMATLIEHYAGAFPLWLAPIQVVILPISDRHKEYAMSIAGELESQGFRVQVDTRNQKTSAKIADAETQKIPYMLVIGDREISTNTLAVRRRGREDLGAMKLDEFTKVISGEIHGG